MRALQAKSMLQSIKENDLVSHTARIGSLLNTTLTNLFTQPFASNKVHSLRGLATFLSWDFHTSAIRDEFVQRMRNKGVQMGGCGEKSVRLRPMLTFGESHMEVLVKAIEEVLREM